MPEHHRTIRTHHARKGRISARGRADLAALLERYGVPAGPLDLPALFAGRPVALEIGSGLGDAALAMAAADPDVAILAVEVHTAGVLRLLRGVDAAGLPGVRVAHEDAVDLLRNRVPDGAFAQVRAYFPDPWPKARHHKRRLVRPEIVALIATRLRVGGLLHLATDVAAYADAAREVLGASPSFELVADADRRGRPVTRYERVAHEQGRPVQEILARRVDPPGQPPQGPHQDESHTL